MVGARLLLLVLLAGILFSPPLGREIQWVPASPKVATQQVVYLTACHELSRMLPNLRIKNKCFPRAELACRGAFCFYEWPNAVAATAGQGRHPLCLRSSSPPRAFVAPATGESVWYMSNGIDKPFLAELLKAFARTTGAGRAQDRAAARQCRLASPARSDLSGRHPASLSARLRRRTATRRGRSSTSRWSTNTSRRSTISMPPSATDALL
jgi:hypothetical protein